VDIVAQCGLLHNYSGAVHIQKETMFLALAVLLLGLMVDAAMVSMDITVLFGFPTSNLNAATDQFYINI
jgi:hypothetical protein